MGQTQKGVAAAPGIAIGRARVYATQEPNAEQRDVENPKNEIDRFIKAVRKSADELLRIEHKATADLGPEQAKIIEAHRMMLEDPEFSGAVQTIISNQSINAEAALRIVAQNLADMFAAMDNEYMRERAADIQDIAARVTANLQGVRYGFQAGDDIDVILVARDLHPSDTIQLDLSRVKGFVTDIGGRTSHTAIMARTRGIPAVVGTGDVTRTVANGTQVIVDGTHGVLIIDPTPQEIAEYQGEVRAEAEARKRLHALTNEPSVTLDGRLVELAANIGAPEDASIGVQHGAEGVGLFRSEFLFMKRRALPSENEQFSAYKEAAETLRGKPVIIRTLDIGGDKTLDYLDLEQELNPFLGYRAIRISLHRQDLFKTQLRAILRASSYGRVKVMYPMIATLDEVFAANQVLEQAKQELREEGVPFDGEMEVGMMVEVPSAAIAADQLAEAVDFFSIGTNDLIQYTMACDRMNERVTYLYQPYHPAILRLIKMVVDAAHNRGKWVGVCGEMAGDLLIAPILIGLGVDELSMSTSSILPVRERIRQSRFDRLQTLAHEALNQPNSASVQALIEQHFREFSQ